MKTLAGHLTAGNKKAIKAILNTGFEAGKVGNSSYYLSCINGIYTVEILTNDRGLIPCPGSELRLSRYTSTFKL